MQYLATLETDIRLNLRIVHGYLYDVATNLQFGDIIPTDTGAEHWVDDQLFLTITLEDSNSVSFHFDPGAGNKDRALCLLELYQETCGFILRD